MPQLFTIRRPASAKIGKKPTKFWLSVGVLFTLFVLSIALLSQHSNEPSYAGKGILKWFALAKAESNGSAISPFSTNYQTFEIMEGDAVPFLIKTLQKKPSRIERWYELAFKRLPASVAAFMPKPRDYLSRRILALQLMFAVANKQLYQWIDEGTFSSKTSITNALPALKAALHDPDIRIRASAAISVRGLGFLAAPLIPDLIPIAADAIALGNTSAMDALGLIGPPASNAIPVLVQVLTDPRRTMSRASAAQSLGMMGSTARDAAPALAKMLQDSPALLRETALRALSEIGCTPAEAVPILRTLHQDTNDWVRIHAALALWNRDRENTNLFRELTTAIRTATNYGFTYTLGWLGTNAAPFVPELQRNMRGIEEGKHVKRALNKIQPQVFE